MKKVINWLLIGNLSIIFILLLGKVNLFKEFLNVFVGIILMPTVFGVFLYYLLMPLNTIFRKKGMKDSSAAMLTIIIAIIILLALGRAFSDYLIIEFFEIKKVVIDYINSENFNNTLNYILEDSNIQNILRDLWNMVISYFKGLALNTRELFNKGMILFSNILLIFLITFFIMKDGDIFKDKIIKYAGNKYKNIVSVILNEGDEILSTYVIGQAKVALSLSTMVYIGYKTIKMPTPFLFAITTFILAFIPFVGFLISMIIPYIIAISMGIPMIIKITILFIIAQTLKGRIVVPLIMGKTMNIHPLTDIFLVVSGSVIGGPLLAFTIIPVYSLIKMVLKKSVEMGYITTFVDKNNKV